VGLDVVAKRVSSKVVPGGNGNQHGRMTVGGKLWESDEIKAVGSSSRASQSVVRKRGRGKHEPWYLGQIDDGHARADGT